MLRPLEAELATRSPVADPVVLTQQAKLYLVATMEQNGRREELFDASSEQTLLCSIGFKKGNHCLLEFIHSKCVCQLAFYLMRNKRPAHGIVYRTHRIEAKTNHIKVCAAETKGSIAVQLSVPSRFNGAASGTSI